MIRAIMRRFALSRKGAENFCRGVLLTVLLDLALMLPMSPPSMPMSTATRGSRLAGS